MQNYNEIVINRKWCKNCGICVACCPKKVLALDANKALEVVDIEACSGCMMCEYRCPDMAIAVIRSKVV
jgi:2-oxoglutarate ferredoxin oxidoreductase subunit delta